MRIVVFLLALFFLSAPALAQSASRDDALAAYNRATVRPGHDIDRQLLDRLAADFPDHINALREEYVRIYLEQGEFAANSNALPSMTAIIVQLFPHYIRRADDESIIAMNAVTLDFSRAVAQTDPMRCTYNFTGQLMPNGRPALARC